MNWSADMKILRIGIMVIPTSTESELATVAHCIRQHADREQAFLVDMAQYVPDEQLLQ